MVRRLRSKEGGFTLVELMVVVMIIAILMAIAIPTFLNSRKRAQDSSAKSSVRNGLAAAQSVFSETQTYAGVTQAALAAEEPGLTFGAAATTLSTGPNMISFSTATADTIFLAALSKSDRCFALKYSTTAGSGGTMQAELTKATCNGAGAAADGIVYTAL
jgi:type IV pilus assembly protein PilA